MTITSCIASTEAKDNYSCKRVHDGNLGEPGWMTYLGLGVGAWIKIDLDEIYRITKVKTMNRGTWHAPNTWNDNFKDILLGFSDGNIVNFTLTNIEYPDRVWDTIELVGNGDVITSSYVVITALAVYNENENVGNYGFAELKVYGCPLGKINDAGCNS